MNTLKAILRVKVALCTVDATGLRVVEGLLLDSGTTLKTQDTRESLLNLHDRHGSGVIWDSDRSWVDHELATRFGELILAVTLG